MIDQEIIRYLEDRYDPRSILIYGSHATGEADDYSDFDCLLIVAEKSSDHDGSVVAGTQLDCYLYTAEETRTLDPDLFLPCMDAVILKDRDGDGKELKERVKAYAEEKRITGPEEKDDVIAWYEKTLRRIEKRDDEGNYRAIVLLDASLEDYFLLRDLLYRGSRRGIAYLREEDKEGYELFRDAVTLRTNHSIEAWVRHVIRVEI